MSFLPNLTPLIATLLPSLVTGAITGGIGYGVQRALSKKNEPQQIGTPPRPAAITTPQAKARRAPIRADDDLATQRRRGALIGGGAAGLTLEPLGQRGSGQVSRSTLLGR